MDMNITIDNSVFRDNSTGIGTINVGTTPEEKADMLEQLEALRMDLIKVDQLNVAITSLEAAIREQNQPKVQTIIQQLTSNFTSSFLANVISNIVSPFL